MTFTTSEILSLAMLLVTCSEVRRTESRQDPFGTDKTDVEPSSANLNRRRGFDFPGFDFDLADAISAGWSFYTTEIYPGTKWCGSGSLARHHDDLGPDRATDMCCREHDLCPDSIRKRQSAHGLTNDSPYTRSHCDCDERFRRCLLELQGGGASQVILAGYFDGVRGKCFRLDYPVTSCLKRTIARKTCTKYAYDRGGRPFYQWFDLEPYIPFV